MALRILTALLLMTPMACGEATDSSGDNWWENGETPAGDSTESTSAAGQTEAGDKEAGDKEAGDSTEKNSWTGQIDIAAGTGTFTYLRTQESGENCSLSYPVASVTALSTCDSCSFAWDLELGDVNIVEDAGGCGDYATMGNTHLQYGHGIATLAEYGGVTYYALYESTDGASWASSGGYSTISDDGTQWGLGTK